MPGKPASVFPGHPFAMSRTWVRAALFSVASNAAVLAVIGAGRLIRPEGLPVNSQHVFWLASGVNVAGLLLFGLRFWPVLLLNAVPPWLIFHEPPDVCLIGAAANAAEALAAAWFVRRAGAFRGGFDAVRATGALIVASLVAPLTNTLVMPAWFCAKGVYPWSSYARAIDNWNFSNGAAMLALVPAIVAFAGRKRARDRRGVERVAVPAVAGALCFVGFCAMFRGEGMNFALLAFLPVVHAAVRFGTGETAAVLVVAEASVYAALFAPGATGTPEAAARQIWFAQALCWVLSATGLLVAALGAERRRAELASVEASLAAERARFAALAYRMNPHFLFNALNSVRASLPLSQPVAREMLTDFADYLRSSLERGDTETVALADELRSVREYLRIERHRFGERLDARFDIAPDAESATTPVFLLQPLVENAIRHGLESSPAPCVIVVSAKCENGRLRLEVSNTGRWREPGGGRQGVGLANVRDRLRLLHGDAAVLEIGGTTEIVRVVVSFPA